MNFNQLEQGGSILLWKGMSPFDKHQENHHSHQNNTLEFPFYGCVSEGLTYSFRLGTYPPLAFEKAYPLEDRQTLYVEDIIPNDILSEEKKINENFFKEIEITFISDMARIASENKKNKNFYVRKSQIEKITFYPTDETWDNITINFCNPPTIQEKDCLVNQFIKKFIRLFSGK